MNGAGMSSTRCSIIRLSRAISFVGRVPSPVRSIRELPRLVNARSARGREESGRRAARCGHLWGCKRDCRQRLRLRRAAVPRHFAGHHCREARKTFSEAIQDKARSRVTGYGLDEDVQMGRSSAPKAARASFSAIDRAIAKARTPSSTAARQRSRGMNPVTSCVRPFSRAALCERDHTDGDLRTRFCRCINVDTLDEHIALVNSGTYGNQACLFTSSGANARRFRHEAEVGNIGVNIAVAAPMAFFPFSGARDSFFGDLHGQGRDAIEFFTQEKVVVERWPASWTRKF